MDRLVIWTGTKNESKPNDVSLAPLITMQKTRDTKQDMQTRRYMNHE